MDTNYHFVSGSPHGGHARFRAFAAVVICVSAVAGVLCMRHSSLMMPQNTSLRASSLLGLVDAPEHPCNNLLVLGIADRLEETCVSSAQLEAAGFLQFFNASYTYEQYQHDRASNATDSTYIDYMLINKLAGGKPLNFREFEAHKNVLATMAGFVAGFGTPESNPYSATQATKTVGREWRQSFQECVQLYQRNVEVDYYASGHGEMLDISFKFSLGDSSMPENLPRIEYIYLDPPGAANCRTINGEDLPLVLQPGQQYNVHCSRADDSLARVVVSIVTSQGLFHGVLCERAREPIPPSWQANLNAVGEHVKSELEAAMKTNLTNLFESQLNAQAKQAWANASSDLHEQIIHIDTRVDDIESSYASAFSKSIANVSSTLQGKVTEIDSRLDEVQASVGSVQSSVKSLKESLTSGACAICSSCGGTWPVVSGENWYDGGTQFYRGNDCGGNYDEYQDSDVYLYLCCVGR